MVSAHANILQVFPNDGKGVIRLPWRILHGKTMKRIKVLTTFSTVKEFKFTRDKLDSWDDANRGDVYNFLVMVLAVFRWRG